MNIAAINKYPMNYYKISPNNAINNLKNDAVSFSRLKDKDYINSNIQSAYNLGIELYNNPDIPSNVILEKYAPYVEIIPINKASKAKRDEVDACIYFQRNADFSPVCNSIYARIHPKSKSKADKLIYSLLTAHEYTHYKQLTSKEDIEFMKKLSDDNLVYLGILMPIGDRIFDEFDEMKFDFTKKIFNFKDTISRLIHQSTLPRKQSFTKGDILASAGMKTEEDFKEYINKEFDRIFNRTIQIILTDEGAADKPIRDFIKTVAVNKNKLALFKKDIKKYCIHSTRMEYEAYKTESLISKKVLNVREQLNIDSYLMYYSMLEDALSA